MNIAVGLVERRPSISLVLDGQFTNGSGEVVPSGRHTFTSPVTLHPTRPERDTFVLEDVTIGVGFHWQRSRRLGYRGSLRILLVQGLLTAINDVELETYVESVIGSEMSARSPVELLKAHAVISRSWLLARLEDPAGTGTFRRERQTGLREWEILSWYGREAHDAYDVCGDDHCQRYQGLPADRSDAVAEAVGETAGRVLTFGGKVCDTRFSKCCGGMTEDYRAAWEDIEIPYLRPVYDGAGEAPVIDEGWFGSSPAAYCNTSDPHLLERVLPGFDRETRDFFRWRAGYTREELSALVLERSGIDLGEVRSLEPVERGASGRLVRLRIRGARGALVVGKELEIRRVLSRSHLYSSAFAVRQSGERFELAGAGWGHGVGLCQIGAAVMASSGMSSESILLHYYPGSSLTSRVADPVENS